MSLLSDVEIQRHMAESRIVIYPYSAKRLNTDSYDLSLGRYFYRYLPLGERRPHEMSRGEGFELVDALDAGGIWLEPGERVLAHSQEVAGGRAVDGLAVTTHIQATSTAARHGITAVQCAGWGDVGFINIWTLEVMNHTRDRLWLPVGAIIAQVCFTSLPTPRAHYGVDGRGQYQDIDPYEEGETILRAWRPENMLPGPLKTTEVVDAIE